jgi:hypothetical protein
MNESALTALSPEAARRLQMLPIKRTSTSLLLAVARVPTAADTDAVLKETALNPDYAIAEPQDLAEAIERAYPP